MGVRGYRYGIKSTVARRSGGVAFAALAGVLTVMALIGLEMVLGIAWAIDFPTRRTALFTLVGSKRVTNAVSLESVSMQGTKIIGPVLGGVLLAGYASKAAQSGQRRR